MPTKSHREIEPDALDHYFSALDGPLLVHRLLHLLQPTYLLARAARYLPARFLPAQIYLDSLERPAYAYGLYMAALQARVLGHDRISAIEFGVAGGNGLLALESLAGRIGDYFGLAIEVHGFDMGSGLPQPRGYRDHPYLYRRGDYAMDEEALRSRLSHASLWLGPVAETLPIFAHSGMAPIGFVSFDLDYYSSTVDALEVFNFPEETRLPRVICYFDDILIPDYAFFTERAGELRAIAEFNQEHPFKHLSRLHSLAYSKRLVHPWHAQVYVLHDFNHDQYEDDFQPESGRTRALV